MPPVCALIAVWPLLFHVGPLLFSKVWQCTWLLLMPDFVPCLNVWVQRQILFQPHDLFLSLSLFQIPHPLLQPGGGSGSNSIYEFSPGGYLTLMFVTWIQWNIWKTSPKTFNVVACDSEHVKKSTELIHVIIHLCTKYTANIKIRKRKAVIVTICNLTVTP